MVTTASCDHVCPSERATVPSQKHVALQILLIVLAVLAVASLILALSPTPRVVLVLILGAFFAY
jgi:hypothetical protein